MAIDGDSPTWEVTDASGERPTVKGTAKECNGRYRGSHPTPEIVFQNGNRMEFNSPTFHQPSGWRNQLKEGLLSVEVFAVQGWKRATLQKDTFLAPKDAAQMENTRIPSAKILSSGRKLRRVVKHT